MVENCQYKEIEKSQNENSNYNQCEEKELFKRFLEIRQLGWIEGQKNNYGSAGIIFEKLLNKNWTNFEIPDYNEIEIKTKSSLKEKYITLFSAVPDSFLFEIKRLVNEYGYPDSQYPQFNIFNLDIYSYKYKKSNSNYFFKLEVDDISKNVVLNIYNQKYELIDNNIKWSFDVLKEKLYRKLSKLAIIEVDKKYIDDQVYFKYQKINFYRLTNFEKFLELIKKGKIRMVFKIGIYKRENNLGKIYDHGSAFSIKKDNLDDLFQKVNLS